MYIIKGSDDEFSMNSSRLSDETVSSSDIQFTESQDSFDNQPYKDKATQTPKKIKKKQKEQEGGDIVNLVYYSPKPIKAQVSEVKLKKWGSQTSYLSDYAIVKKDTVLQLNPVSRKSTSSTHNYYWTAIFDLEEQMKLEFPTLYVLYVC